MVVAAKAKRTTICCEGVYNAAVVLSSTDVYSVFFFIPAARATYSSRIIHTVVVVIKKIDDEYTSTVSARKHKASNVIGNVSKKL